MSATGGLPGVKPRVLFLTNVEAGQSNVIIAVGHELHRRGADVHFAALEKLKENLNRTLPDAQFHPLSGPDLKDIWETEPDLKMQLTTNASTNLFKMIRDIKAALLSIFPWSGPQYLEVYNSVLEVVADVEPDLCVIDPALNPALTAMQSIRQPFLILSPNTIKDFAFFSQPKWDQLAKFPCLASGFPYPLPWHLVPRNIMYTILAYFLDLFDNRRAKKEAYIKSYTGSDCFTFKSFHTRPGMVDNVKVLVSNRQEIEFPLKVMLDNIIPCGPIIRPGPVLAKSDPELSLWLDQAPTIYINLGTHVYLDGTLAMSMANALLKIVEQADSGQQKSIEGLQVLWKLKTFGIVGNFVQSTLYHLICNKRVKVVEWIDAEPAEVVAHRNIAVVVSHGGANSFHEAVVAGKPQVILPPWMDCYDFASRVDFLGIGVWGNRNTIGRFTTKDLLAAFEEILIGPRSAEIQEKARALAETLNEEPGREKAADVILEQVAALRSQRWGS